MTSCSMLKKISDFSQCCAEPTRLLHYFELHVDKPRLLLLLLCCLRIHCMTCTISTPIMRSSDINDPIRCTQWARRFQQTVSIMITMLRGWWEPRIIFVAIKFHEGSIWDGPFSCTHNGYHSVVVNSQASLVLGYPAPEEGGGVG